MPMKKKLFIIATLFIFSCNKITNNNDNGNETTLPINKDVVANFSSLLTEQEYENMFPKRYGYYNLSTGRADKSKDFFTYQSLLDAIGKLANIRIEVYAKEDVAHTQKVVWYNKITGESRENITHPDYNASLNLSKKETKVTIDYANFCNEGSLTDRKRELCAFLANISHETTGGGYYEKTKTWGLYWREEVYWQTNPNTNNLGYRDESNSMYPPYPGKSYHGRGPIQISYNYNYGQVSECIYGDKNVLLKEPEKVLENGTNAFMTAIWFWMTPQSPKPSCHQVMAGTWKPTSQDLKFNRNKSKFGMTVNIINGGLECNTAWDYRGMDRLEFYDKYLSIMGIDKGGDICTCQGMTSY